MAKRATGREREREGERGRQSLLCRRSSLLCKHYATRVELYLYYICWHQISFHSLKQYETWRIVGSTALSVTSLFTPPLSCAVRARTQVQKRATKSPIDLLCT